MSLVKRVVNESQIASSQFLSDKYLLISRLVDTKFSPASLLLVFISKQVLTEEHSTMAKHKYYLNWISMRELEGDCGPKQV